MLQNRSWKIDENIFHQKCFKQHSLATESVFGDASDDVSFKKPSKFHVFSHQSATVGLSIVNQPYHAHDRALHCGTRLVAVLPRIYLCEFLELEAQLRICCCHR